jgi:hypothetical protein
VEVYVSKGVTNLLPNGGYVNLSVDLDGGGGLTDSKTGNITITGKESYIEVSMKNGKVRIYSPEEILVHELVSHGIPVITPKNPETQSGTPIDRENKVRREMPSWEESVNPFKSPVPANARVVGDYHTHGDYSTKSEDGSLYAQRIKAKISIIATIFQVEVLVQHAVIYQVSKTLQLD